MPIDPLAVRSADHPILPLFLRRWSPRALSGQPLDQSDLDSLLEAARWAPSTYNEQEWRFLYGHRDTRQFALFFDLLFEANQAWCKNAAVLVLVCSHQVFSRNGKPNPVHTFDAGAAFENLCLQAAEMDLVAHGMAGFDQEKARRDLAVPEDFSIDAMIALGHPGNPDDLPEEVRKMEQPSGRKPLAEIACAGRFSF